MIARSIKVYWPFAALWLIVFISAIHKRGMEQGLILGFGVAYTASLLYLTAAVLSKIAGFGRFSSLDLALAVLASAYVVAALASGWELLWFTVVGILTGAIIWLFSHFHSSGK